MPRYALVAATAAAFCGAPACAENYPARPITLVVPFVAGGSASVAARSVADKMGELLGQQIVIDNRGGAGGTVATRAVAKAAPDGYTLLVVTSATVGTSPALFANLGYDPRKDFEPIGLMAATPNLIAVHPSFPAHTLAEWVKIGQETREPIPYGSPGTGTLNHLTVELIAHRMHMKLAHVVYRGAGPALNDTMGGRVHLLFSNLAATTPHVKSGRLRALAVTSAQPTALAPSLPTIASSGLPGYEAEAIYGVVVPAGTPVPIINRLNQEVVRALNRQDVKDKYFAYGVETVGGSAQQLADKIKSEMLRMGKVIKDAGIKGE